MPPNRPPRSRPRGGGRQPVGNLFAPVPPPPSSPQAKVWAAKQQLTSFDLPVKDKAPKPSVVRRPEYRQPPPSALPPPVTKQQVDLATRMQFDPSARHKFAKTLTLDEKRTLVARDKAARQAFKEHPSILDVGHVTNPSVLATATNLGRFVDKHGHALEHLTGAATSLLKPTKEFGGVPMPKGWALTGEVGTEAAKWLAPRVAERARNQVEQAAAWLRPPGLA